MFGLTFPRETHVILPAANNGQRLNASTCPKCECDRADWDMVAGSMNPNEPK